MYSSATHLLQPQRLLDAARPLGRALEAPVRGLPLLVRAPPKPLVALQLEEPELPHSAAVSLLRQQQQDTRVATLELEINAKLHHTSRECARLQQAVKSVRVGGSGDVVRLQGMVEHLESVETELVVHQLLLQGLHEHPDGVHCSHDPALEQQAAHIIQERREHGLEALLSTEAAGGVDCDSLDQTETQALMSSLNLEIQYLNCQYDELRAQAARMQADPTYRFSTSDPLAACRWHRLLHAHKHIAELEEAILLRQLLLRNLKANPDCIHSLHDPALEHEARQMIKVRKQLERQLGEAVSSVSKVGTSHIPAAMTTLMLVLALMPSA